MKKSILILQKRLKRCDGDPETWEAKERELFAKVRAMADGTYGQ